MKHPSLVVNIAVLAITAVLFCPTMWLLAAVVRALLP